MGQLRDDLRRTTEQYRELNQALAQQQQQMTSLQVSKISVNKKNLFITRTHLHSLVCHLMHFRVKSYLPVKTSSVEYIVSQRPYVRFER